MEMAAITRSSAPADDRHLQADRPGRTGDNDDRRLDHRVVCGKCHA